MRIGFDGKRATQNFTGLGNYSRFILQILTQYHPENEYEVYSTKNAGPENPLYKLNNLHFHYPSSSFLTSLWRTYGISRDLARDFIDVFHGLSNEIPEGLGKAGIPAVVTIHDLIFLRHPQYFPFIDRKIYRIKTARAVRHAEKIIAISQQTKTDLINFLKVPEGKIEVVYQNCDPIFKTRVPDNEKSGIRKKYQLPSEFLLNVGTIENRKNVMLILKALIHVEQDIPLVIIGKDTPYILEVKEFIRSQNLGKRVIFLKNIPFTDLPAIYQMSSLFIYPSEFEGFGIPVLEALHSGVPVIAATGSSLEEAAGISSVFVHPHDADDLAFQINKILASNDIRSKMVSAGYEHTAKFDEKLIADQLHNIYQSIL